MKRGNVPLFSPPLLLSVLLLLLLTSAPFKSASAKGPILTPPPISIYFSVKQGSLASISHGISYLPWRTSLGAFHNSTTHPGRPRSRTCLPRTLRFCRTVG